MEFGEQAALWFASSCEVVGKRIAEIGSDPTLFFANKLASLGAEHVIASNIMDQWALRAPAANVTVTTANGETLHATVGRNSLDAVAGCNILEHIQNIPQVLGSIYAALKPGGICWLHGDPVWTSSRGHHIMLPDRNFHGEKPIIPHWGHLYMTQEQLQESMAKASIRPDDAHAIQRWIYTSFDVSRNSRLRILADAMASRFELVDVIEGPGDEPADDVLHLIKSAGLWWNPMERYNVRGIILCLKKN